MAEGQDQQKDSSFTNNLQSFNKKIPTIGLEGLNQPLQEITQKQKSIDIDYLPESNSQDHSKRKKGSREIKSEEFLHKGHLEKNWDDSNKKMPTVDLDDDFVTDENRYNTTLKQ